MLAAVTASVVASEASQTTQPQRPRTASSDTGLSGGKVIIGLKEADRAQGVLDGRVVVRPLTQRRAVRLISALRGVEVLGVDRATPAVFGRVAAPDVVERLRTLPLVEYVEPDALPITPASGGGGCFWSAGGGTEAAGGVPMDVTNAARTDLGDVIPWNFLEHQIDRAWARGATGAGITVAVIDTGTFAEQAQLWPAPGDFSSGRSDGCWVKHINVTASSEYDTCMHGTHAAGTLAAPFDGKNIVGVAWKSNMVAVKAFNGVNLDRGSALAAAAALNEAVASGAKVISMAFGDYPIFGIVGTYKYLANTIDRLHRENDVLFFGAAGSNVCELTGGNTGLTPWQFGVAFPARLADVVAVTGLNSRGNIHWSACGGPEVDLAATVTTDTQTTGRAASDIVAFGATSDATTVVAGVAALVWSKYPMWNRDQVRRRLYATACCANHRLWGYGNINAYAAVGGFSSLRISASSIKAGQPFTASAVATGDGPFQYRDGRRARRRGRSGGSPLAAVAGCRSG
jgi:subtilisin family serine protease